MDADWTHRVLDRPWVDHRGQRQAVSPEQFQLLLQNGQQQYYLVQETSAGQPVTLCLYFHDLLDEELDTFADLPSADYTRFSGRDRDGFEKVPVSAESERQSRCSASRAFVRSSTARGTTLTASSRAPTVTTSERKPVPRLRGFCFVNHPDVVEATPREEIVDPALAEMRPIYVDDVDMDVLGTELRNRSRRDSAIPRQRATSRA